MTGQAGPAAFVDLHMHSTASDGSRAPADVVRAAKAAGLAAIALTDHDSIAGLAEAQIAGAELGVRIVNGVELSAVEGEAETHLLGLHLRDVLVIERELGALRDMRERRGQQIVEKLVAIGVLVTFDDVLAQAGGGAVGRPHVARALIALGLDGVEVKHPGHSPSDTAKLNTLATQLGLVLSGGSDWHGAADGPRTIGMMQVPWQWLALQDAHFAALGRAPAA